MPSEPNFVEIEHNIIMTNYEMLDAAKAVISHVDKSVLHAQNCTVASLLDSAMFCPGFRSQLGS